MKHTRWLSIVAGLGIAAGLPPWGWWPLTIVGLALWFHLLEKLSPRARFGRSLLLGAAWFYPSTIWMADLTALGWPIAAGAFSIMIALVGWVTPSGQASELRSSGFRRHGENQRSYKQRGDKQHGLGQRGAVFCCALVLAELIRWNWPFGGVPISTLALVGVATPLAPAARLFGSPVLVMLLVLAAVIVVGIIKEPRACLRPSLHNSLLAALLALVILPLAAMLPWFASDEGNSVRVAVVQGGGPQNTRAELCQNRQVFERHMAASRLINEPVDLVLWPEDVVHPAAGSAVINQCSEPLLGHEEAASRISQLATELNATVVTGWFKPSTEAETNLNYAIVTDSNGAYGDSYQKVKLVPFGEYVPLRSFIERFSSALPTRDVQQGTSQALLRSEIGLLGVAISWEIFFDHRARDAIGNGGRVLLNPTNGSSYWLSIVQSQQVASSRLRAIETNRWVLQAAPTGFSAIINPAGSVVARSAVSEQKVLIETIQLRKSRTPAVVLGIWPVLVVSLTVLVVALAMLTFRQLRAVVQRISVRHTPENRTR